MLLYNYQSLEDVSDQILLIGRRPGKRMRLGGAPSASCSLQRCFDEAAAASRFSNSCARVKVRLCVEQSSYDARCNRWWPHEASAPLQDAQRLPSARGNVAT